MSLAVANQYAKALLDAVSAPSSAVKAEDALAQIDAFNEIIKSSHELKTVLLSPALTVPQKQKAVARLCSMAGLAPLMLNFFMVVIRHRRLPLMAGIRERFQALLDESHGLVRADVTAAKPLTDSERAALEAALAQATQKQVRCGYSVDENLLGGVSVRVGSRVLDGSVRGQLNGLRRRLTGKA